LKRDAKEGKRISFGQIAWQMKEQYIESRKKGTSYIQWKEGSLNALVTSCLIKHAIQGKINVTRRRERRRKQLLDSLA